MTFVLGVVYLAGALVVVGTVDPLPLPARFLAALVWPALIVGCAAVVVVDKVREF